MTSSTGIEMKQVYLTELEIAALHSIQLEMLLEFDRVCSALSLHYHLAAGSLLGAVRHKGFIPWDDDIDVIMPRADYQRLLTEGPSILKDIYFLQHWRSDPSFQEQFSKLRRNGSQFRELSRSNLRHHHGIYIDIFPFDFVEPTSWWGNMQIELVRLFKQLNALATHPRRGLVSRKRPYWQRFLGPFAYMVLNATPRSLRLWLHERTITAAGVLATTHVTCLAMMPLDRVRAHRLIRPVAEIYDTITMNFEGHSLRAPAAYHNILKRLYGDYHQLPPADLRVPQHSISKFELP